MAELFKSSWEKPQTLMNAICAFPFPLLGRVTMRPILSESEQTVLNAVRTLKEATAEEVCKKAGLGKNVVHYALRALELSRYVEVCGVSPRRGRGVRAAIYSEVED